MICFKLESLILIYLNAKLYGNQPNGTAKVGCRICVKPLTIAYFYTPYSGKRLFSTSLIPFPQLQWRIAWRIWASDYRASKMNSKMIANMLQFFCIDLLCQVLLLRFTGNTCEYCCNAFIYNIMQFLYVVSIWLPKGKHQEMFEFVSHYSKIWF